MILQIINIYYYGSVNIESLFNKVLTVVTFHRLTEFTISFIDFIYVLGSLPLSKKI